MPAFDVGLDSSVTHHQSPSVVSVERIFHLEQALLAMITAAGQQGIGSDVLCAQAVGGLMTDRYWHWANAEHRHGAAEIESAMTLLFDK